MEKCFDFANVKCQSDVYANLRKKNSKNFIYFINKLILLINNATN
jgi:hypothetical protein